MSTLVPTMPLLVEPVKDLTAIGSVPDAVVRQEATSANLMDVFKVIAFLILAIACRYAATGSLKSPIFCDSETSAEHSRFMTTPAVDLMDLSTAGF